MNEKPKNKKGRKRVKKSAEEVAQESRRRVPLDLDTYHWVKAFCDERGQSVSGVLKQLVEEHMAAEKFERPSYVKPPRPATKNIDAIINEVFQF